MKKALILMLVLMFFAVPASANYQFFPRVGCTGAGDDNVEDLDGSGSAGPPAYEALADGDTAFVVTNSLDVCIYVLDDDANQATTTESPCPQYIRPLSNPGTMSWVLSDINATSFSALASTTPTVAYKDSDATAGDVNCRSYVNCTDTGDTTEDCDWTLECQVAGSPTNKIVADADGNVTVTSLAATNAVLTTPTLGVASATSVVGSITLAGNPSLAANTASPGANGIIFEGSADDAFEGLLTSLAATSDKTWTLPNTTGTVSLIGAAETFSGVKTFSASPVLTGTTITLTGAATLAGNPAMTAQRATVSANGVLFEGTTADTYEGLLTWPVTASDKTQTLQDVTGTIYCTGGTDVADADVVDALTISGGTVNNSVIGGVTPAAITGTTGTFTSVVTPLLDAAGAEDMDYGSADVTDHTFITDGGVDSLTIGNNADLDFGITIDSDTNDFTLNWDEDNAELELTSVGDEDLVIDLDTATDNEVGISSSTGVTQINLNALNLVSTGTILGAINIVTTTDGAESPTAEQMYGTFFVADNATAANDTDYTLPTAAAGMSACFYDNGAGTGGIIVDAAAGDEILLDGAGVGTADAIDSPGVAGDGANGDFICILAIDATNWVTMGASGTWVDGGAD